QDVHRWDLLPPKGQGWPMDIAGRLNLVNQQIDLQSSSSVVPLTTRFHAGNYLSRPRWAVTFTWNRIPIAPVLQLAGDMGAQLPPKLRINGFIDGAIGYSNAAGLQGELVLHNTSVAMPDSAPLRFDEVHLLMGKDQLRLPPSPLRTAENEVALVEANYSMREDTLDVSISSENMKVGTLRAQAGLHPVPWLEQLSSGRWSGQLRYHREPGNDVWTGNLQLEDAKVSVPGLAHPLAIDSARVGIDGHRLAIDRLSAQAGTIPFTGEYRYEPNTDRPHRLRIRAASVTAGDLEQELMPALHPASSLLARALGRDEAPDWLRHRKLEGTVRIGDFELDGVHLEKLQSRMVWDLGEVDFPAFEARLRQELPPASHLNLPGAAVVNGSLFVTLSARAPVYKLSAKARGLNWQGGKVDAEGTLETSGTGARIFTNARLFDLSLRTEEGIYIGQGAAQGDGRLSIVLTNGNKQMRMTGTLAALKLDEEPAFSDQRSAKDAER
ncbi:MAG: hypothetical protein JO099_20870, partial [Acidobacteriia bacterium]|nr:hypothetical protein [Terriglobia bacterium]